MFDFNLIIKRNQSGSDRRDATRSRVRGEVTVGQLSCLSHRREKPAGVREARQPRLGRQVPTNTPGQASPADVY